MTASIRPSISTISLTFPTLSRRDWTLLAARSSADRVRRRVHPAHRCGSIGHRHPVAVEQSRETDRLTTVGRWCLSRGQTAGIRSRLSDSMPTPIYITCIGTSHPIFPNVSFQFVLSFNLPRRNGPSQAARSARSAGRSFARRAAAQPTRRVVSAGGF